MKLVIFNGSPRFKKSNSALLIEQFLIGYKRENDLMVDVYFLANKSHRDSHVEIFEQAQTVLIFIPLYTDSMPGIVKEFFENIACCSLYPKVKKIGFVVQSGFLESIHSSFLEKYLRKFTKRLNCEYLGTVIKGGVEGIQYMPPHMTKKLYEQFVTLGEYFGHYETFDSKTMNDLKEPYTFSTVQVNKFRELSKTGETNLHWDNILKKNGAYEKRFDKPYQD
jgi:multimeric flavodoxin WrbA